MAGLIGIFIIGIWIWLATLFSRWTFESVRPQWQKWPVRWFLWAVFLIFPVADEIVGRWQFQRLCEREALVWLSPDWQLTSKALQQETRVYPKGYVVAIRGTVTEIFDIDSNKKIMEYRNFMREGGFLHKKLSWDTQSNDYCRPKNLREIYRLTKVDQLLKNGEMK